MARRFYRQRNADQNSGDLAAGERWKLYSTRRNFELDAQPRIGMRAQYADASGDGFAAVHRPGECGVLGARHIAKHAAAPLDADRVRVVRVGGLAHQLAVGRPVSALARRLLLRDSESRRAASSARGASLLAPTAAAAMTIAQVAIKSENGTAMEAPTTVFRLMASRVHRGVRLILCCPRSLVSSGSLATSRGRFSGILYSPNASRNQSTTPPSTPSSSTTSQRHG